MHLGKYETIPGKKFFIYNYINYLKLYIVIFNIIYIFIDIFYIQLYIIICKIYPYIFFFSSKIYTIYIK